MTVDATPLQVLVRSSFDPVAGGLQVWAALTGPGGAGIESAEFVECRWLDREGDEGRRLEVPYLPGACSWSEVWVRVENCQPVPVGRLVAIREGGQGG